MRFTILRPSCLQPEDDGTVPEARRLSVLAAEMLGFCVRRRVATPRPGDPSLAVFDWRPRGVLAWRAGLPNHATDIVAALELVLDANTKGYRMTLVTMDFDGAHRARVDFDFVNLPANPPPMWMLRARAEAGTEAEAITVAYLTLCRSIHPMLEEITCPTS